nr:bulb-type lectin domain-containing protein [Tanacetum cinerariifolium]
MIPIEYSARAVVVLQLAWLVSGHHNMPRNGFCANFRNFFLLVTLLGLLRALLMKVNQGELGMKENNTENLIENVKAETMVITLLAINIKSKEMLVKRMKEVEAFNTSKMSAKTRDHAKKIASTRKEKRARCYICKEIGHVFWKCQNKRKDARIEKQKESVKPANKNVAKKINYDLLEEQRYKVKISNNKCNLHYMFDEARTGKAQKERFIEDDGLKDVVTEHNKFLDEYFESIDPKEDCSLVNGLEYLKWDINDIQDYVDEEYISWNGSLYALKDDARIEEALEEDMNKKTQFGVRLEGNVEEEAEEGSTTNSNDFIVIV